MNFLPRILMLKCRNDSSSEIPKCMVINTTLWKLCATNHVCNHPLNNLSSTMTPTLWPYSYLFITSRNTNHLSPWILLLDERKTKAKALQIRYIRYIRNQTNDFSLQIKFSSTCQILVLPTFFFFVLPTFNQCKHENIEDITFYFCYLSFNHELMLICF